MQLSPPPLWIMSIILAYFFIPNTGYPASVTGNAAFEKVKRAPGKDNNMITGDPVF